MKKIFLLHSLVFVAFSIFAQTVPVTFHLDANNTQYQTVQMWHSPDYLSFTDDDEDRIFELTLDLVPGIFDYHILRDNAWGWDPHNPVRGRYSSSGASMTISDPMISYLLPKDDDMLRENRLQANFAYSAINPPLLNSIAVTINGNSLTNSSQYFDAIKRQLLLSNLPYLINGENTVTVSYSTNKGPINRSSTFTYRPIKLMMDTVVYRMDAILGWGRVFTKPYPISIFLKCNDKIYTTTVNSEGYFGVNIDIVTGSNSIKVATSEAGLSNPVDQMEVTAEIRHKWWVELTGSINGTTATIEALPHDIDQNELTLEWRQAEDNPAGLSVSGSSSNLSFNIPEAEGNYIIELHVSTSSGESYFARKLLTTKGNPHFIGVNERAPWMETMVLYEVEGDFFDWGRFTFQKMKQAFRHMKDLGINSFRIAPFNKGGFISWDHFEISPSNGSMSDLQDMIETAHQYGIKVFFDVPLSHIASFSPFILPNFLLKEKAEPYYHFNMWKGKPGESDIVHSSDNGRQCVYTNLDNPYTQDYFTRLMEYWVEVAGCDGFRIDCGQESFLRSPEYIKYLHKRLRNINPNLFILEEGENRDHPDVNYYDFGDAAYDWMLNTEWNGGTLGLPGMFQGNYSVDQLHELLTTGTPDSGLVMRYANTGYFDYLSKLYGKEQERSAVALVATTYGLPNIRAGEEVGLARANGMYDLSDPDGVMPRYTRLIKSRKELLGNYPKIERYTEAVPDLVYAYVSKSNGNIVFTIINFSTGSINFPINLQHEIFENKGMSDWYNVVDDLEIDNSENTSIPISLAAWESKVYVVDRVKSAIFPTASSIALKSTNGIYEINSDRATLAFIASILPESTMDEIQWELEGDTLLASLTNGILSACGCGDGEVVVIAKSAENQQVEARKTVFIRNQTSGQIQNSTFDQDVSNWSIWAPECNNTLSWDNGEAKVTYNNGSSECWAQFMANNDMHVELGKKYKLSFDARASKNSTIRCVVREGGNNYDLISDETISQLTTDNQRFSLEYLAKQSSDIAQIQLSMGAGDAEFWFDNVSFCEVTESTGLVKITFQVDMQFKDVSPYGVFLRGDFNNWNSSEPLQNNGTVYYTIIELEAETEVEYKFVNGDEWENIEEGSCINVANNMNRFLIVPNENTSLEALCFNNCEVCEGPAPDIITIAEVQGATDESPYVGQLVEIQGEVTFATEYGCYLQDGNSVRSGIFVYNASFSDLSIGTGLKVKGVVEEYNGLTELEDIESSETFSSSFDIIPMKLPKAVISEDYECMLVYAENVEAIEANDFGDWYVKFDNEAQFLVDNKYTPLSFVAGENYKLTGIIEYNYEEFKLSPRTSDDIVPLNLVTELVEVTFQVDMQNEMVSSSGVYLNGSFCDWNTANAIQLTATGTVYSTTLQLNESETIEYKFVNGEVWEELAASSCTSNGDYINRAFTIPQNATVLDLVCFNSCYTCEVGFEILSIAEVQGATDESPYVGQLVEIQGEVTFATKYGCYLQDGNSVRSGIFVYNASFSDLSIATGLKVKGIVDEYNGLTDLKDIESSETFSSSFDIIPMKLPKAVISEDYECMLVYAENVEAIEANDFGDWYVKFDNEAQFLVDNKYTPINFVAGEKYKLTGIIEYNYEEFKLSPRTSDDIVPLNLVTELVEVTFQVDMINEQLSDNGVYLVGNFCNWNLDEAILLNVYTTPEYAIWGTKMQLPIGESIEYKFVNGIETETFLGDCLNKANNRYFSVPESDTILTNIYFNTCERSKTFVDILLTEKVKVYPNPVEHIVYITGLSIYPKCEVKLLDVTGKILYSKEVVNEDEYLLDMTSFPKGNYSLIVASGSEQVLKKLLKK